MIDHDDEALLSFLEESKDHLDGIEEDLLALEDQADALDDDLVNKVFRAAHTIKGTAGFFAFGRIKDLAHAMESVLGLVRSRDMAVDHQVVSRLLAGADLLRRMIEDIDHFDDVPTDEAEAALRALVPGSAPAAPGAPPAASGPAAPAGSVAVALPGQPALFALSAEEVSAAQYGPKGGKFLYLAVYDTPADGSEPAALGELADLAAVVAARPADGGARTAAVCCTVLEPELFFDFCGADEAHRALLVDRLYDRPGAAPAAEPAAAEPPKPPPPAPKPKPAAEPAPPAPGAPAKKADGGSIRVSLAQLDRLMALAGELVLTRNALLKQTAERGGDDPSGLTQQIDAITTDMQEAIMATRMQSMGTVFTKFKRVVRDLAQTLKKEIDLVIEGEDVELDKTIIEAITDPLTHLVRNSVDHGIEEPESRARAGKRRRGRLLLKASHQAGQVLVEIADDGAGIDAGKVAAKAVEKGLLTADEAAALPVREKVMLIFKPGLSTAAKVTDVSGRGVGMDVVLTNLQKVGGAVEVDSRVGAGTRVVIKLPLTLAIMPSLLVAVGEQRFAIPQVNLVELLRIPAAETKRRIERIGVWPVMRLRGELLPLVRLADVLGVRSAYVDPGSGARREERRLSVTDRRSPVTEDPADYWPREPRDGGDRRSAPESVTYVVVVASGSHRYGVIVDQFLDSEEIVVKPLGSHVQGCREYAGATILGDGSVALILDIAGVRVVADLVATQAVIDTARQAVQAREKLLHDANTYLLLRNGPDEQLAVPLGNASRIERFRRGDVVTLAGRRAVPYGDGLLALVSLDEVARVQAPAVGDPVFAVVFRAYGRDVGLLVTELLDIVDVDAPVDPATHVQPGILGSVVVDGTISLIPDLHGLVDRLLPEYRKPLRAGAAGAPTVLVVEDSPFFRHQMSSFLAESGYAVLAAEDGEKGLEELASHADEVRLIVTDIEMPRMDGLEMTRRIRTDPRFERLPILAVTSLSGDLAEKRGREAGLTEYLIKLDREQILERCSHHLA